MGQTYTINTDGGSRGNPGPSAIGFSITLDGSPVANGGWPIGKGTNNEAEYKAIIWGLQNALALGVRSIRCIADSELMVKQVNGAYKVKSDVLKPLCAKVKELAGRFDEFSLEHALRSFNKEPDALVNKALDLGRPVGAFKVRFGDEPGSLFDAAAVDGGDVAADVADAADASPDATPEEASAFAAAAFEALAGGADAAPAAGEAAVRETGKPQVAVAPEPAAVPSSIAGKTVLVGVTGCIAVYKACEIVRLLQKAGARVKVCMTEHATQFVGPATFRALTNEEVAVELFDSAEAPIHHISLAKEADAVLVAPCTANVMAKLAYGIADDLLTTTVLACTAPLVIAPAMNTNMWENEKTQASLAKLRDGGARIVEPDSGYLSCGDSGAGRLADIEHIADAVLTELARSQSLLGKKVMITSGPTHEPIDPVRYIGNRSSGITGKLIAEEAAARGAEVVLVQGPVSIADPAGVQTVHVQTAQQMLEASQEAFDDCDAAVFCAAVADFRPANPTSGKIKKSDLDSGRCAMQPNDAGGFDMELVRNPDILKTLAAGKGDRFVVGFAAETGDVVAYATDKLESKNADLVVANDVSDPALGFGTHDNRVWLVSHDGVEDSGVVSKRRVAQLVMDRVEKAICG